MGQIQSLKMSSTVIHSVEESSLPTETKPRSRDKVLSDGSKWRIAQADNCFLFSDKGNSEA